MIVPPQGRLSLNSRFFQRDTAGILYVNATYTTLVNSVKAIFATNLRFSIRSFDLHPQTLDPSSREDMSGSMPPDSKIQALEGLKQSVGTVSFHFPEVNIDGSPNYLVINAQPDRQLIVDPLTRKVTFCMRSNGQVVTLHRSFLAPKEGLHFACARRNDEGYVDLFVDGMQ